MSEASRDPRAIFLMGPTASGKTELALRLVERLPLEIVSVDSAMVYRGMDIGTAKPDAATLQRAPHRLIDIVEPEDPYSAGRFCADARDAMSEIRARGSIPLLVGGTMLYFKALDEGLGRMPPADGDVRERLAEETRTRGLAAMHAELARVDPAAGRRIHPNDPQRTLRALEVYRITGQPISAFRGERSSPAGGDILRIAVAPSRRGVLHERVEARFDRMLEHGLLDEVAGLMRRPGLERGLPSMRAVGYRQAWAHLAGESDRATMRERAIVATRQLAKRQLTWLRRMTAVEWLDATAVAGPAIEARVRAFLDNA